MASGEARKEIHLDTGTGDSQFVQDALEARHHGLGTGDIEGPVLEIGNFALDQRLVDEARMDVGAGRLALRDRVTVRRPSSRSAMSNRLE